MERARAHKTLADAVGSPAAQMVAFMSVFDADWMRKHPKQVAEIIDRKRRESSVRR
jgi:hypothetical protein